MNRGLVFGGIAVALAAVAIKGASVYNQVTQALGTFNFAFSFVRIHGLVGEGITKFTNPCIRVIFNLNLKNFTGLNIEVDKIYARVETNKAGTDTWSVVATPTGYLKLKLDDGKEINKQLEFDFKGLSTITSLTNKTNRHRVVITCEYKGQKMPAYNTDLDITGPISAFWAKTKASIPALRGIEQLAY